MQGRRESSNVTTGAPSTVCTVAHREPSADRCSSKAVAVSAGLSSVTVTVVSALRATVTLEGAAGVLYVVSE